MSIIIEDLNEENFQLYASKAYDRPHAVMSEFIADLSRIKYLKRLFRKYQTTKKLKTRLILNHLIILYNVFGPEAATRILFFKIEEEYYGTLKTFLLLLGVMPVKVRGVNGKDIISADIQVEATIAQILRKI